MPPPIALRSFWRADNGFGWRRPCARLNKTAGRRQLQTNFRGFSQSYDDEDELRRDNFEVGVAKGVKDCSGLGNKLTI